MSAPHSDFETVPVGTLAKMERMRGALNGGVMALRTAINSMRPDDPERHKCVAAGDEMISALEDKA